MPYETLTCKNCNQVNRICRTYKYYQKPYPFRCKYCKKISRPYQKDKPPKKVARHICKVMHDHIWLILEEAYQLVPEAKTDLDYDNITKVKATLEALYNRCDRWIDKKNDELKLVSKARVKKKPRFGRNKRKLKNASYYRKNKHKWEESRQRCQTTKHTKK